MATLTETSEIIVKGMDLASFNLISNKKINWSKETLEKTPELAKVTNLLIGYGSRIINLRSDDALAPYFLDTSKLIELYSVTLVNSIYDTKKVDADGKVVKAVSYKLTKGITVQQALGFLEVEHKLAIVEGKIDAARRGSYTPASKVTLADLEAFSE